MSKKKIALFIPFAVIGAGVVLAALAAIFAVITSQEYTAVFDNAVLYAVWIALLAIGVGVVVVDVRMRGSKRVLKVNTDLENSHFMDMREIAANTGFTVTSFNRLGEVADGVPIYAESNKRDIDIVLKDPIHTLVIGATGTGKTAAFVSPTIEILARTKTKPSVVVTDPKGELYAKHAATLRKNGYTVNVIDLSDVYHSTRWNPFNDVWRKTDEMLYSTVTQKSGKYYSAGVEYLTNAEAEDAQRERIVRLRDEIYVDLQDLVYTMCPIENKHDQTWQRGARDLLFALALAFWEDVRDGYMPREKFNLYNLYRNVTDYAKGDCDELKAYFETRRPESRTRGLSNTVLVSEDRTLSSYLGDVNQYLNWMADGGIAALTSGNDIEFTEFDEAPNALFLKIPDEKENRYKLVTLFMTQMYKALVEKATRNKELSKTKEQTLLRNVYFLMDEFGNLPKMYNMDKIVTVGRSRHIYMVPVIQDFNQLDDKYGKEVAATIRSNCNIQIFIGSNDENTRKIISEACGKKKVKQISYSENRDMSVSTSAQSVPLIYPNELEHLNDPANGVIGNAIVLCLGNYPIRSKITPIFRAGKFYKPEHTEISKGAFIDFDEAKTHYDIERVTIFLNTDAAIRQGAQEAPDEQAGQVGQVRQPEPVSPAADQSEKKVKIDLTKQMLVQVDEKTELLRGKIPADQFEALTAADFREKIDILNSIADGAMEKGNFFLSAECATVKNFILYRCFSKSEIEEIRLVAGA